MESVKDLLADPQKGLRQCEGVLCYLFREILLWKKVNTFTWEKMLTAYFKKPHNQVNPDKGNLNKALKANTMNWSSFKKGIDFLSPYKAYLDIELIWGDGRPNSVYRIDIDPTVEEENIVDESGFDFGSWGAFAKQKPALTAMARLYRYILWKEGIDEEKWNALWAKFANHPVNTVGQQPAEITKYITNQRRSLLAPKMTWNTFRNGLLLLGPKEERYTLTLQWTDDKVLRDKIGDSVHTIPIPDPFWIEPDASKAEEV